MSFLDLSCEFLSVDALDILGSNRVNITGREVQKWHLDPAGVKRAYHGRNRAQRNIAKFDKKVTAPLADLHENGVHAPTLVAENIQEFIDDFEVAFIAFVAPWCIWCQRLMPTIEVLAEEMERMDKDVGVAMVDCTVSTKLCRSAYEVKAFPTLKTFSRGELQSPDYSSDRTVDSMSRYLSSKLSANSRRRRARNEEGQGVHDDKWPGCMVSGHILVNRVPGNFHVEAASDSHTFHAAMTNLSHIVHHMSFGEEPSTRVRNKIKRLDEDLRQYSPMDGNVYMAKEYHQAPHHYIRVVGTTYNLGGMKTPYNGYQAVANSHMMLYDVDDVPEARFTYNLSPMSVLVRTERKPWYDFLTKVLAIIGGMFSVIGLVDAAAFRASRKNGRQLS